MSCSLTKPRGSLGKDARIILRLVIRKTEAPRRQVKLPAVQKGSVTELKTGLKRQDPPELWFSPEQAFLPPFWPWEYAGAGDGGHCHHGGSPQPREHGGSSHHLHGQQLLLGPSIHSKGILSIQRCRWTPHPGTLEAVGRGSSIKEGAEARPRSCIPHIFTLPALQKPFPGRLD